MSHYYYNAMSLDRARAAFSTLSVFYESVHGEDCYIANEEFSTVYQLTSSKSQGKFQMTADGFFAKK